MPVKNVLPPRSSFMIASSAVNVEPSLRSAGSLSRWPMIRLSPVPAARASSSSCRCRNSSGTIMSPSRHPIASARVQPNVCSAAGFHSQTTPSSSMTTMQSSEESSTASCSAAASRARLIALRNPISVITAAASPSVISI